MGTQPRSCEAVGDMPVKAKKKQEVVDTGPKLVVKQTDMSTEMQNKVFEAVKEALKEHKHEKDMCAYIKKKFDELHPQTTWHCIAGSHFGVSVTHATDNLMFLSVDNTRNVLLFKSME